MVIDRWDDTASAVTLTFNLLKELLIHELLSVYQVDDFQNNFHETPSQVIMLTPHTVHNEL